VRYAPGAMLLLLLACTAPDDTADSAAPAGWDFWPEAPPLRGPGSPGRTFTEDELWVPCASLDALPSDALHHNLQVPYRGHLVMPWAPEYGVGGLSLFDMSDPCAPTRVGDGESQDLRETHAIGFAYLPPEDPHAGDWAVTNGKLYGGVDSGVLFWDLSDPAAPAAVKLFTLPDAWYPDSYTRVALSVYWQYPWLYVASSDNGIFVIDATDPTDPVLVNQVVLGLRAGGVFALGNELLVTSAEQTQAALLDISDPANPALLPGSPFSTVTRDGDAVETYHGNRVGDMALFARKEGGGGPIVMDISEPATPTFVGDTVHQGNAGYVFYDEGYLFVGESDHASIWDARDPAALTLVGTGDLAGDLDTNVPWGNVALLSVDEPETEHATVVMPWNTEPDTKGPAVLATNPGDGSEGWYTGARVGVGFDEFIEPGSVYPGSIRLYDGDGAPVDGWASAQETIASYTPKSPLSPGTTYTVEVSGVTDIHGNVMEGTHTFTFSTAGAR
jgi:hypothetical protein